MTPIFRFLCTIRTNFGAKQHNWKFANRDQESPGNILAGWKFRHLKKMAAYKPDLLTDPNNEHQR